MLGGATGSVETVSVMAEPSMFHQHWQYFKRPSTLASEDELGAHAAADWHQSVEVSLVAEVSNGHDISEHVRHSLLVVHPLCP